MLIKIKKLQPLSNCFKQVLSIYLFKFKNGIAMVLVLVYALSTLNRFHTMFWCFNCLLKIRNADCSKNWIKKLAELFPECLSGLYLLSRLAGKQTINISEEVTNICQEREGLQNANSDLFIYQKE